jgi:hypothetical protein
MKRWIGLIEAALAQLPWPAPGCGVILVFAP